MFRSLRSFSRIPRAVQRRKFDCQDDVRMATSPPSSIALSLPRHGFCTAWRLLASPALPCTAATTSPVVAVSQHFLILSVLRAVVDLEVMPVVVCRAILYRATATATATVVVATTATAASATAIAAGATARQLPWCPADYFSSRCHGHGGTTGKVRTTTVLPTLLYTEHYTKP